MTNDVYASLQESNERTLEWLTSVHTSVLEATKSYVDAVRKAPASSSSTPPEVDVPDVRALIADSFDFQAQVLQKNREFSLALADTWADAAEGVRGATPASPKAAAKK